MLQITSEQNAEHLTCYIFFLSARDVGHLQPTLISIHWMAESNSMDLHRKAHVRRHDAHPTV